MLNSISNDLLEQDEKAINEHIEAHNSYMYATPRQGIFKKTVKDND